MAWGKKSGRTHPLPSDWRRIRAAVLQRDGYRCTHIRGDNDQRCPDRATDVDHIGDDNNHTLDNLQSLCRFHHARKTSSETAKKHRKKQETPLHPSQMLKSYGERLQKP